MTKSTLEGSKVVTRAEWLAARKEHLKREKEFTRLRDELSRQRRELPWVRVEKEYVFDGPKGKETLANLFGGFIGAHPYKQRFANNMIFGHKSPKS